MRRAFAFRLHLLLAMLLALACASPAHAQPGKKMPRLGYLAAVSATVTGASSPPGRMATVM